MAACRPAAHGSRPTAQMMRRRAGIDLLGFHELLILTREKFFNEDEISVRMKEVIKDDGYTPDRGMDECCNIAESMIEEIHQIAMPGFSIATSASRRHKGSLKERLLRQIRAARKVAMV